MNDNDITRIRKEGEDTVRRPGRFEGEARYVPYFWGIALDGCCDQDRRGAWIVPLESEDKVIFPELKRRRTVKLLQDSNGFICEV